MTLRVNREASREAKFGGFPYQVAAVEAVRNLEYAAVFHEQGLGKTKIAIDIALSWLKADVVDSVLFLTKKALVANWKDEIRTHSFLTPRTLDQNRNANFYAFNSPARFYLANYEVCVSEASRLKLFLRTRRVAVICDEAQKFKNPESRIATVLFELGPLFTRRLILTGTPIANRPQDIWALIYFLDQGQALGKSFEEFRAQVDLTNELSGDQSRQREFENAVGSIFEKIRPFALRETKASAGIQLPTKTIENVAVVPEDRQWELYESYRDELKAIVVRDGVPRIDEAEELLKRLLRLVQIASNPRMVDDSYDATPAKLETLEALLTDRLGANGEFKSIVWTSFTDNADWLSKRLRDHGAVRVHGKMSIDDRNRSIRRFKTDEDVRVLVATPGAAKEGLTLTVANTAVFFDRGFSLDDYLQAQDRIHRISQERECVIYNLLMRDSIDEWVDELLAAKQLASQLALGDVSAEEYTKVATYSFAQTLARILGPIGEN